MSPTFERLKNLLRLIRKRPGKPAAEPAGAVSPATSATLPPVTENRSDERGDVRDSPASHVLPSSSSAAGVAAQSTPANADVAHPLSELSVSPLSPRRPTARRDDWYRALRGHDEALLAELVQSEAPGESLLILEAHLNAMYRGYERAKSTSSQFPDQAFFSALLETFRQEKEWAAQRVLPIIESIRNNLGWDVRGFNLQFLKTIRQSSALSLVLGAGVSCADPCRAPSWPALVKELLQTTLDGGLEVPVPPSEDTTETPVPASGGPGPPPPIEVVSSAAGPDRVIIDISQLGHTQTVNFEQKKVKEYTHAERQQAQHIIRKIDARDADNRVLMQGAELAHSLCGQHLFTRIHGILYRNQRQPSAVHRAIARLAHPQDVPNRGRLPGWDAIITCNFDAFMSEALTDEGVAEEAWAMCESEPMNYPNGLAENLGNSCPWVQKVLHLHGYTPRRPFPITNVRFVFATSQYIETYNQAESAIFRKVIDEYLENPVHVALYVGCSFTDEYMNGLLEKAILRMPGRYHYALLQWPKEQRGVAPSREELRTEERRYLDMGVRPIWFDEFTEIPHLIARLE